ncbi:MAG: PAS domain-containing protein [Verrucomicrobiota bacterium]
MPPPDASAPSPAAREKTLHDIFLDEDSFHALFDQLAHPVLVEDAAGRLVFLNLAAKQRFALPDRESLLGTPAVSLLLQTPGPSPEGSLAHRKGLRWQSFHRLPVHREGGTLAGVFSFGVASNREERLRRENDELRRLFDRLPQFVYLKDLEGRFRIANAALAAHLGTTPEDIIGRTDADFFDPPTAQAIRDDECRLLATGDKLVNKIERTVHPGTGQVRWLMTTKVPMCNDAGEAVGLGGMGTDVTVWHEAQTRVRLQAAALDAAANSILLTDHAGRIVWSNEATTRVTAYSREELHGLHLDELETGLPASGQLGRRWSQVRAGEIWTGEIVSRRKDGASVTEQATLTPLRDESGAVSNFIAIRSDITNRKRLEEENRRISAAIEHAEDAILLAGLDGHITYANRSFFHLFGAEAADIISQPLTHLFGGAKTGAVGDLPDLETILRHGWEERLEVPTKEGPPKLIRLRVSQIRDEEDGMLGFACYLYDLGAEQRQAEERRLMEVRLRQAQKLESIGHLAAGIAHEINTPTQFVGDNLHFLGESIESLSAIVRRLSEALGPEAHALGEGVRRELCALIAAADFDYLEEELPAALTQARDGVQRIAEIVKAMKEFSHPGTRDRKLARLNDALEKAVTVARNEWKYHADVTLELDPALEPVRCLPAEVNQVFLNLIVNAAHTVRDEVDRGRYEKGHITISTRQLDDAVEIRVADNGAGIPAEIRDRIFDPFFTTKGVGKGTGQGLAIAYDVIVHKHDGTILCESEEGAGTTFILHLPQGHPQTIDGAKAEAPLRR